MRARTPNEASFLASLQRARSEIEGRLGAAQQRAGERVLLPVVKANAPRRSGRLAAGLHIVTTGTSSEIVSREPYGAGAEHGLRGKWSGFRGSPPRYAGRALDTQADKLSEAVLDELREPVHVYGWFR